MSRRKQQIPIKNPQLESAAASQGQVKIELFNGGEDGQVTENPVDNQLDNEEEAPIAANGTGSSPILDDNGNIVTDHLKEKLTSWLSSTDEAAKAAAAAAIFDQFQKQNVQLEDDKASTQVPLPAVSAVYKAEASGNGSPSSSPPKDSYQCPYCSYVAPTRSSLNIHKHRHERPAYKCNECNYTSFHAHNMQRHLHKHMQNHRFKCPYCNYSCPRENGVKWHMNSYHSEKGLGSPIDMGEGEYPDASGGNIRNSFSPSSLICGQCGFKADTPEALGLHAHVYSCEVCRETFSDLNALRIHMKSSHAPGSIGANSSAASANLSPQYSSVANNGSLLVSTGVHFSPSQSVGAGEGPLDLSQSSNMTGAAMDTDDGSLQRNTPPFEQSLLHQMDLTSPRSRKPASQMYSKMVGLEKRYFCKYCTRNYKYCSDLYVHIRRSHSVDPISRKVLGPTTGSGPSTLLQPHRTGMVGALPTQPSFPPVTLPSALHNLLNPSTPNVHVSNIAGMNKFPETADVSSNNNDANNNISDDNNNKEATDAGQSSALFCCFCPDGGKAIGNSAELRQHLSQVHSDSLGNNLDTIVTTICDMAKQQQQQRPVNEMSPRSSGVVLSSEELSHAESLNTSSLTIENDDVFSPEKPLPSADSGYGGTKVVPARDLGLDGGDPVVMIEPQSVDEPVAGTEGDGSAGAPAAAGGLDDNDVEVDVVGLGDSSDGRDNAAVDLKPEVADEDAVSSVVAAASSTANPLNNLLMSFGANSRNYQGFAVSRKQPRAMEIVGKLLGNDGNFYCNLCNHRATQPEPMLYHLATHEGLRLFKCSQCLIRSNYKTDILRHVRKATCGPNPQLIELTYHEAKETLQEYLDSDVFKHRYHKRSMSVSSSLNGVQTLGEPSPKVSRLSLSSSSPSSTTSSNALNSVPISMVPSSSSSQILPTPNAGDQRLGIGVGPSVNFRCSLCGFSAEQHNDVATHAWRTHANESFRVLRVFNYKRFRCALCGLMSVSKGALANKHFRKKHPNQEPQVIEVLPDEDGNFTEIKHEMLGSTHAELVSAQQAMADMNGNNSTNSSDPAEPGPANAPSENLSPSLANVTANSTANCTPNGPMNVGRQPTSSLKKKYFGLKIFKCVKCPYRSNWSSDIYRHVQKKHGMTPSCITLDPDEARTSLQDYEAWFQSRRLGGPSGSASSLLARQALDGFDKSAAAAAAAAGLKVEAGGSGEAASENGSDRTPADRWQCPKCAFTVSSYERCREHCIRHVMQKVFQCRLCQFFSNYQASLSRHCETHHRGEFRVVSDIIEKSHQVAPNAVPIEPVRVTGHGGLGVSPSSSAAASALLSGETGMVKTEPAGPNGKVLVFSCKLCQFQNGSRLVVKQHLISKHGSTNGTLIDSFRTPFVGDGSIGLASNGLASTAAAGSTSQENSRSPFSCKICPYSTVKFDLFDNHQKLHVPSHARQVKCDFCDYFVSSREKLHNHLKLHQKALAGNGGALDPLAILTATVSTQKCPFCEYNGPFGSLIGHVLTHTNTAGPNLDGASADQSRFNCSKCPFVGQTSENLLAHEAAHQSREASPFQCDSCDFNCDSKQLLVEHLALHMIVSSGRKSPVEAAVDQQLDGHSSSTPSSSPPPPPPPPAFNETEENLQLDVE